MIIDIKDATLDKDMLGKISKNREHNRVVSNYYRVHADGDGGYDFYKRGMKLYYCNKYWDVDYYMLQNVKDFKRTMVCNDKFCMNCKKLKQAVRIARFKPELDKYDNLYHMVLTVPNVQGSELKSTVKLMFKAFKSLINYLNGKHEVLGLDFDSWGYKGALRSLEVTYKHNYHPHLHVIIKLDGFSDEKYIDSKRIQNDFSVRHGEVKRLFSPQEILLQKVWYLLNNGITVTKYNVDSLDRGYSCMFDPVNDDDYYEVFKYLTKGDGSSKDVSEDSYYMSYNNFVDLWYSLYKVRQIQGYGCFYNLKIDDAEEIAMINEMDIRYDELIAELQKNEQPVFARETIQAVEQDTVNTYISRKRYLGYLRELYRRE